MASNITLLIEGFPPGGGPAAPIEVLSFSLGLDVSFTVSPGSGGAGTGKATLMPLTLTRHADGSSDALYQAAGAGRHFPKATLTVAATRGEGPFVYQFSPVIMGSVRTTGSQGEIPTDEVVLHYGSLTFP